MQLSNRPKTNQATRVRGQYDSSGGPHLINQTSGTMQPMVAGPGGNGALSSSDGMGPDGSMVYQTNQAYPSQRNMPAFSQI